MLPLIVSEMFSSRHHFYIYGRHYFSSALETWYGWATNSPAIITVPVGSLVTKLYGTQTYVLYDTRVIIWSCLSPVHCLRFRVIQPEGPRDVIHYSSSIAVLTYYSVFVFFVFAGEVQFCWRTLFQTATQIDLVGTDIRLVSNKTWS